LTEGFASPNFLYVLIAPRAKSAAVPSRDVAGRTGLSRVDWVRLIDGGGFFRAEVVGVGFRLPVTRPIPMSLATDLIAAGVPHVTRAVTGAQAGA
jgi:hypothetical protein